LEPIIVIVFLSLPRYSDHDSFENLIFSTFSSFYFGKNITIGMVTSKVGKRYAFTGFDALKELFLVRLASSGVS